MAAEMDNAGSQDLAQFWKEVPKPKVMEHRSVKYLHILGDGLSRLSHQNSLVFYQPVQA